ncbi:amino acid ABC transporter permease [Elongatibacter sediminis]|uniref:ABC transporter permease subunit n=1 Tax=Elongatibacter sediminis TaxID=3119006 RepID=A0AAW9R6E6_9GAMM
MSGSAPPQAPSGRTALRVWALQVAVLAVLAWGVVAIGQTTLENLDRLGVESGFEFLGKRAGFDINQTLFSYSSDSPVYQAFLIALCNTVLLAVLSIALATLMGLVVALCRISRDWFLNALGYGFIEVFRNIPALLQIFFWYYVVLRSLPSFEQSWSLGASIHLNNRGLFLPGPEWNAGTAGWVLAAGLALTAVLALYLRAVRRRTCLRPLRGSWAARTGFAAWLLVAVAALGLAIDWQAPRLHAFGYDSDLVITPELGALIMGLAVYNASSVAEVIRAGFLAVPRGQWEAARSLGLSRSHVLRHVILPQAMRVIVPPLTTCYLNIFKATSLGAAIGYPEIVSVMVGTTNNIVGRPVEIMFLTFAVYSLVSLLGIGLMSRLNRRHNRFMAA